MEISRRTFDELITPLLENGKIAVVTWGMTWPKYADRGIIARRLSDLFGEAKIIVFIRNQPDYIISLYRFHYGKARHSYSFKEYLQVHWDNKVNGFVYHLDYYKLVTVYANLFGRDKIGIFLFEELVRDPKSFARKMCDFIGADPDEGTRLLIEAHKNPGQSATLAAYTRLRKLVLPKVRLRKFVPIQAAKEFKNFLSRGPAAKVKVSQDQIEVIRSRFRESNRMLAAEYRLPLAEFGYTV